MVNIKDGKSKKKLASMIDMPVNSIVNIILAIFFLAILTLLIFQFF